MGVFNVTLNFNASFTTTVEANDEGEALDKARDQAYEADMNQYILGIEKETECRQIG